MTNFRRLMALCLAGALAAGTIPSPAQAEKTRFWRQSSFEDFERGTAKGVALRSDGKLVLAPRFSTFADPSAAYLWSLRLDSKGNLYTAAGGNARVLRFDAACVNASPGDVKPESPKSESKVAKGQATASSKPGDDPCKPVIVFESGELSAQAIELDAQDNLYIGTSPDGKVYKVTPKGEKSTLFDPKTKYIWDLTLDAAGNIYVATGDKGEVYLVKPDGKAELYFRSEETHARSLAFDARGNLIVGTEPSGLIVRVEKAAGAAADSPATRGFVLYETSKKEVTALLADKSGNIYAAAIGEKPRVPLVQPVQPVPQPPPQVAPPPGQQLPPQPPTQFVPFPPTAGGAEVLRITPDGAPEEVWSSREEFVYALGFSATGKLLLGTGNRGLLVQIEGNKIYSSLAKTASSQVTGIAAGPGGRVFLCTANPGKLFTLGPEDEPEGSFASQTFDAKIFSQWGRLSWWGENGTTEGKVEMYVRTGNTSNPERSWSAWAGPFTDAKGSPVGVPAARFAQWKAVFKPTSAKPGSAVPHSMNISWVDLAYLPKNVAPSVDAIVIQNPGVRVQGPPAGQPGQRETATIRMPAPPGAAAPPAQPPGQPRFDPPPAGTLQRGARGAVWSATDANEDDLFYTVYFRGEGEKTWKLLKEKLENKFVSWDTGTMPDGAYYLKVAASDGGSNPVGEGLTAERESDRFEVDNTPPAVEGLRAESANPETRVRFDARDNYSPLTRVEWSLDAGEWKVIFPRDRTTDSALESYELTLRDLSPGEHTLAVRVFDQFENSASAKVNFVVEAPKKR